MITVAILDDDAKVRESLAWLLNRATGLQCLGTYATLPELMDSFAEEIPEVLLLDVKLQNDSGIHAIRHILKQIPSQKILMYSNYDSNELIGLSMAAGACGYISKNISITLLCEAIITVSLGGSVWPAGYARTAPNAGSRRRFPNQNLLLRKIRLLLRFLRKMT